MSVVLDSYTRLLDSIADTENFFFIQIGVHHAGEVDESKKQWSPHLVDPLYRYIQNYPWSGILVEPLPSSYSYIQKFYQDASERLRFLQCAVSDRSGVFPFYVTKREDLSSLSRDRGEHDREFVDTLSVKCLTLNELILSQKVTELHLLQIDTEGYDCKILLAYDFSILRPRVISFEHRHCLLEEYHACQAILEKEGYTLIEQGEFDSLYILSD